ncbi:ATP-dependent RNA helicase Drs1p [[Candida] jaroonii]|uniref:ATP-dependent RNA helicase Drs1p n=1 Tax=[Candida] jaroonii TaxID=467808 RepID=A0ACA9YE95_9ASCO|nr:ATP-dependent RNA helicase Drs1p [[Candida] jaroonii]
MKDFVKTIDSDSEVSNYESGDEVNPDFHFGEDVGETLSGWDFDIDDNVEKKSVNLDGILKKKGGLTNIVGIDDEDDEDEEDEDNDEDEDNENDDEDNEDEVEEPKGEVMEVPQGDDDEEPEEDSEQAMAEFYENGNTTQQSSVHEKFSDLNLSRPLLKGLSQLGYAKPSPIQSASIPIALMGKDIVAGAVTGSGKTAAYMIPIIERLLYKPSKVTATRVIVLTPTRELAIQVSDVGKKIAQFIPSISYGLAVGGLNLRQQEQQLKTRPDIVIATPGRLIDHIRNSPSFSIDSLEILVIDEADRMLEEGFQVELTEILSLIPKHKRQTLLFSATMNTKIQDLIQLSLQKPVRIMIDPPKAASAKLIQEFVRIRKRDHLKEALLYQLLKNLQLNRVVVFVARKETAHVLRIVLGLLGLKVGELHGSLTQEQRLENVTDFKTLKVPVLICTDLAARGLDIPKIELVINYDMPKTYEIYLHRVGRTARAGRDGKSITFVGESSQERAIVKDAIKSLNDNSKAVSRAVDWANVEKINKIIESKRDIVEEVKEEEKSEKEILRAEMELNKASNMIKHKDEINSRPKRTWFAEKDTAKHQLTKHGKKVNSKKRKAVEAKKDMPRPYKKTKADRTAPKVQKKKSKKSKK